MKCLSLNANLALSQLKTRRSRTVATLLGISLSTAMLTAVCGFVASVENLVKRTLEASADPAKYNTALAFIGGLLGMVIVIASVVVVSNAFRVSAGERTRQFGILKSVGATKRQIQRTVLWEAVLLSGIGIPVGILLGLLVEWIGIFSLHNMVAVLQAEEGITDSGVLNFAFTVNLKMILASAVTAFGTVLLSAYLPARKAAKIPAIQAIRSTGEVTVKSRRLKTSKLTQKLFGYEGTLAAKSLKRSKRAFRATVVSLTISIILLVASGGFSGVMSSVVNAVFPQIDGNVIVQTDPYTQEELDAITEDLRQSGYSLEILGIEQSKQTTILQIQTDHPEKVAALMQEVLDQHPNANGDFVNIMNIDSMKREYQVMSDTLMLFIYGFSGMLALIAVVGAVSTISTNIRSRAREFAVLESVGMTKGGIKKMLNLESILCSLRSLIYGLPLGTLLSFLLYKVMGIARNIPFQFPWTAIAGCVGGVFVVTWITMRFSASRLKTNSMIETIRGE